jgi:hypothetical protein
MFATAQKYPYLDNARQGYAVFGDLFKIIYIYYFLDELQDLQRTIIFSKMFAPPLARLKM